MENKQEITIDKKKASSFILNILLGFFIAFIIFFIWMHFSDIRLIHPIYDKNLQVSAPYMGGIYYSKVPSYRELTYLEKVFELFLPALFKTYVRQFLLIGSVLSVIFISRNLFLRHYKIKLK